MARFFPSQNPGKLLCSHQVCCCFRFAVGPAGFFFLQAMDMQIEQVHCRTAVVSDLPYGGAGPPVRLLSLTSFSAGDLVHRLCMSSSYGCASCRLCLLRHRVSSALVPSCPPPFLSSSTGSSHSSRSFCIQGATEVQDLPGPGECACWTFLLTPTPCLTPSCDKERGDAPAHSKKERLFFCEAGRQARGGRGQLARIEGVPE